MLKTLHTAAAQEMKYYIFLIAFIKKLYARAVATVTLRKKTVLAFELFFSARRLLQLTEVKNATLCQLTKRRKLNLQMNCVEINHPVCTMN